MKFTSLEEAQTAYDELEPKVEKLEGEKTALIRKRDELLGELKTTKTKLAPFADYADQDLDIAGLLDIKQKYEQGDSEAQNRYKTAYEADRTKFEQRLKVIEDERKSEKEQVERDKQEATTARLKADAIAEFSKESHRIRNPEQFYRLFGDKIQRGEDGKLFVGDEYKQVSLADYIAQINEDDDNSHHFRAKGGSGSGTGSGTGGSGGKAGENPWHPKSLNYTRQGQILKSNPALAERLKSEAGVK